MATNSTPILNAAGLPVNEAALLGQSGTQVINTANGAVVTPPSTLLSATAPTVKPVAAPVAVKTNTGTPVAPAQAVSRFVRTTGTNEVYDTATQKYVTYDEAKAQGLFAPGAIQDVNYALPGVEKTGYGGQVLSPYEMQKIGYSAPTATDSTLNESYGTVPTYGTGGMDAARAGVAAANAELNAANKALADFELGMNTKISRIANNPEITKRMAQRRISFLNEPQSEYWLQRIALSNEAANATAGKSAAVEDMNLALKMFELAKPDLVDTQINSAGELIQIYSNPMNPTKPTVVSLGGGFGDEGKITDQQIVDVGGQKIMYVTVKDSKAPGGYRYEEKVLGTSDAAYKASATAGGAGTAGISSPMVYPTTSADGTPTITTEQAAQMSQALAIGSRLKDAASRGGVEGAIATIQLGEELKKLLATGKVETGPVSGTVRAGPTGTTGVVGGAITGGSAGAALGSVVPGIGTVIGGIGGALIGGAAGLLTSIPGTQALGTTTPEWNEFFAKASQMTSAYGKSISGAAISEGEFKRLSATAPSVYAQEQVNLQRIRALQDAAARTVMNLTGVSISY
jgi:hypothetical protein